MKLVDLQPEWRTYHDEDGRIFHRHVETRAEANGISFKCPECDRRQGGELKGAHMCICWSPEVGAAATPGPGRWNMVGDTFETLSLVAGSSSVLLTAGCRAHFHVTNGEIIISPDSGVGGTFR